MIGEYEPRFYFKFNFSWFRILDALDNNQEANLLEILEVYIYDKDNDDNLSYMDYADKISDQAVKIAFIAIAKDLILDE